MNSNEISNTLDENIKSRLLIDNDDNIIPFTRENVLDAFIKIINNECVINELITIKKQIYFTAPEISDRLLWRGTSRYKSLPEILNKYCQENNFDNIKLNELYKKVIEKYNKNGFITK